MKASKALKRLAKIEALISGVTEKYVTLAPAVRKALQNAMAAVTVAKEAVNLEATSGAAKIPPGTNPALEKAVAAKPAPAKAAPKKSAVRSSKKPAPVKKTARQQE